MGRYLEKNFLCTYDLSKEFFDSLGIEIQDVQPLRKVFILKTKEGDKILKKVEYDQNKIEFIDKSLKFVNKTYDNTMKIRTLGNGEKYLKWKNDFYILMDKLEGMEATCTNPIDVEICATCIGKLHKASIGIEEYLKENNYFIIKENNLEDNYENAIKDLLEIKNWITKYKYPNEFDALFLENVDEYILEIKSCLQDLKESNYKNMIKDPKLLALCHNDLAYHNFLIDNKEASIIDFDYSNINLRCVDVSDLMLKWIKNSTFDMDKGKVIIDKYNEIIKLSKDELKLIGILLRFPRDVYSIIRVYYHKEKSWDYNSYLNRLKSKLENDIYRRSFLKEYDERLEF